MVFQNSNHVLFKYAHVCFQDRKPIRQSGDALPSRQRIRQNNQRQNHGVQPQRDIGIIKTQDLLLIQHFL